MNDKLVDVDPQSPLLTQRDAQILHAVTVQYGKYKNREEDLRRRRAGIAAHDEKMKAHGVAAALLILWRAFTANSPIDIQLPDTKSGDLDGPVNHLKG